MSYRYMRVMVFFDLPVLTVEDRRVYRRFRKLLIENGFIMLQESVYCRMTLNQTASEAIAANIRKNRPQKGSVMLLTITEKQFSKMEFITGSFTTDIIDSDERLIII